MNERTHFFTKIHLSHFNLERVDIFVVCKQKQKYLLEQQQKLYNLKTVGRRTFHYVTLDYYLNLFHTILRAVGHPDMHASMYNTDASLILQKQNRAIYNSLKNLTTIKG